MTVCIAGKNKIATHAAAQLLSLQKTADIKLVCCVNQTDTGVDTWQPSLLRFARMYQVPVLTLEELYTVQDLIFLSLEFDKIIKPSLFKTKRLYNIHFSNLPSYKGVYTSIMPILNGEHTAGVTLHEIDPGIDTGNIISQRLFPIAETTSGRELYDLYLQNSIQLYDDNISAIMEGRITATVQAVAGSSYYSKKTIDFANISIDTNKTAWEIHNQIRAFSFRDYQLPIVGGNKIYRSVILREKSVRKPGAILFQDDQKLVIASIDYNLELYIDKEDYLFEACRQGAVENMKQLLAWDFPIHICSQKGWNALIVAAYHGHVDLTYFLLRQGFSLTDTNYQGTTVPMYAMTHASRTGDMALLRDILAMNPDLSVTDKTGKNIFWYAKEYNNREVMDLLAAFHTPL